MQAAVAAKLLLPLARNWLMFFEFWGQNLMDVEHLYDAP